MMFSTFRRYRLSKTCPTHPVQDGAARRAVDTSGFTLVEMLVVLFIIGVLIAILLPAIQAAREAARRATCSSRLKQLGIALHTFHSGQRHFPAGLSTPADGSEIWHSAHALLLPYMEQPALADLYDKQINFTEQDPEILAQEIALFQCPSTTRTGLLVYEQFGSIGMPSRFGTTDYIYCKGATDAWDVPFDGKTLPGGGVFYVNQETRIRKIRDGTSHTMAMGEGAGGKRWPLCHGAGCEEPLEHTATASWSCAGIGSAQIEGLGIYLASTWGCTVEPPNKRPVTDTYFDFGGVGDTRTSLEGGPHSTANFRSDHPGGVNFLFADGSVRFIEEEIDMQTYRALSTMRGGDDATSH